MRRFFGMLTASCALALAAVHCGDDDDAGGAGPGGSSGNDGSTTPDVASSSSGALPDGSDGPGDSAPPKPKPVLDFAASLPGTVGAIAPIPGGGWALAFMITRTVTIAGKELTRVGRTDTAIVTVDANGAPIWAAEITGAQDDQPEDIAVDDGGNVYISGLSLVSPTLDFGGGITLDNAGASNAQWGYWAKFDSKGTPLYAKRITAKYGIGGVRLAVRGGTLAVAGTYSSPQLAYPTASGDVTDPNVFSNGPSSYVFSCATSDGNVKWASVFGDGAVYTKDVSIAPSGDILVAGTFAYDKVKDGADASLLTPAGINGNAFVRAITSAGAAKWSRGYGAVDASVGGAQVATMKDGTVISGGVVAGSVDLGKGVRTAGNEGDIYLVALDPATGDTKWDKLIATNIDDGAPELAVDDNGNVFTSAGLSKAPAPTSIDGVALPTAAGFYVAKLDSKGTFTWVRPTEEKTFLGAPVLSVDAKGHVIGGGIYEGTLDLGGGKLLTSNDAGYYDTFLFGVSETP